MSRSSFNRLTGLPYEEVQRRFSSPPILIVVNGKPKVSNETVEKVEAKM